MSKHTKRQVNELCSCVLFPCLSPQFAFYLLRTLQFLLFMENTSDLFTEKKFLIFIFNLEICNWCDLLLLGIIGLVILNWHRCVVIRFWNNSCNYSLNRTSLGPIDTSRKWYLHLNNNTIKGRASTIFVSFSSSCCGGIFFLFFFFFGGGLPAKPPLPAPLPLSSLSHKEGLSLTYYYSWFKDSVIYTKYVQKTCW